MLRRFSKLLTPFLSCLFVLGCVSKKHASLLPQALDGFNEVKSYEMDHSIYIAMAGTECLAHSQYRAPNLARTEFTYPLSMSVVSDGKAIWGAIPDYNTCIRMPLDSEVGWLTPERILKLQSPHLLLVGLLESYDYKAVGVRGILCGKQKVVFKLTRKAPPENPFQAPRAKVWIEKDTGLITRIQNYDRRGERKGRTRLGKYVEIDGIWLPREMRMEDRKGDLQALIQASNIVLNEPVPNEAFVYVPPDDMIVLDQLPEFGPPPEVLFLE